MELRVAGIVKESVVDGPGFRYVIFAQGCTHCCKGCHNPDTHDLGGGYLVDADALVEDIKQNIYIDGVTFSGGEPFLQAEAFLHIAERLRETDTNIVCYTGFTFEELLQKQDNSIQMLLENIDTLIDGPYIERLKDLSLSFRGSSNQRIIDVQRSMSIQKVVFAA